MLEQGVCGSGSCCGRFRPRSISQAVSGNKGNHRPSVQTPKTPPLLY